MLFRSMRVPPQAPLTCGSHRITHLPSQIYLQKFPSRRRLEPTPFFKSVVKPTTRPPFRWVWRIFPGYVPWNDLITFEKKNVEKDRIKLALRKNSLELHQPYMHIVNRSSCLMSPQVSLARSIPMVLTNFWLQRFYKCFIMTLYII